MVKYSNDELVGGPGGIVNITIKTKSSNILPVANAGTNQTVINENNTNVKLDGTRVFIKMVI